MMQNGFYALFVIQHTMNAQNAEIRQMKFGECHKVHILSEGLRDEKIQHRPS
jgi:hypothetical protein